MQQPVHLRARRLVVLVLDGEPGAVAPLAEVRADGGMEGRVFAAVSGRVVSEYGAEEVPHGREDGLLQVEGAAVGQFEGLARLADALRRAGVLAGSDALCELAAAAVGAGVFGEGDGVCAAHGEWWV